MTIRRKIAVIGHELKHHAPFTFFGALTGVVGMLLFKGAGEAANERMFQVFHPTHVLLSAMVTASLFRMHEKGKRFVVVLLVGYFGAVGVATLSDCVLPFFGETMLGVAVPTHAHSHNAEAEGNDAEPHLEHEHEYRPEIHLGFIEDWYLVNPAAILGVLLAFFWPHTKAPHAAHVLISTWASSFHVIMNTQAELTGLMLLGALVVLFIAVWLPCCISDIVFPLFFVGTVPRCSCPGAPKSEAQP